MANWTQILEDAIVGKVVTALIDEGFRVEMSDQDGGGLFVYAAEDGGAKPDGGFEYWVRLVPGNGADVVVDYTTNLESVMKPINKFVKQFQ
ncbi:MAG: hypothetical protein WC829_01040 [Hyphomicrobium sp.]|jgi:hypothetical protein